MSQGKTDSRTGVIAGQLNQAFTVDRILAYTLLRATVGINLVIHGIARTFMVGLPTFAAETVKQFEGSPLPVWQVQSFAYFVPPVELLLGVLLIIGLRTRWALVAASVVMMGLIFGMSLRMNWNVVFLQMFYSALYFMLLMSREYDRFSIDALLAKGGAATD